VPTTLSLPPCRPSSAAGPSGRLAPLTPEQVCGEHAGRVYRLARRLLRNDADAEDVTQDVLLQVVRKLDTFRGVADVTTWLHRVTVNAALQHRRKAARRQECPSGCRFDHYADSSPPSGRTQPSAPEERALRGEVQKLIEWAIAGLPAAYQETYVLADVHELPNATIGALLGLRLAAVKSRLHRARRLLRAALAPYFENTV
jgi:RNA polymerase sigma-70 factor (ECF subfamily)